MTFKEKSQKVTVKFIEFDIYGSTAQGTKTVLTIEGADYEKLKTTHYHWIDWPDRRVPPADGAILELLEKARVSK
ncbi:hypothetical protein CAEBREN_17369 [Caenorhabditis brenneri]|uniref:Tyrosine-protein phosphatase domain-containing protein n=1 Tax=Caenorhabditis brenneri TaxID=135651 RepID=G0MVM5_CAEBE|nr:hypothetical protein CAEBREN_17369 [Caenorhabditis brenneri]